MRRPDLSIVQRAMRTKGYRLFENPKGFDLNIIGVRGRDVRAGHFDDWLTVSYRDGVDGAWVYHAFCATTDPGRSHLEVLSHRDGTAILKAGQYRRSHQIAKHRGQYWALCQIPGSILPVYRDDNRDALLDLNSDDIATDATGINIHRASRTKRSMAVGRWSAGCQVIADPTDFDVLMTLAQRAKSIYGNHFTYTLLNEGDL